MMPRLPVVVVDGVGVCVGLCCYVALVEFDEVEMSQSGASPNF